MEVIEDVNDPEQKLGDVDWEEDAEAACTACGHEGVISDFLKE